MQDFLRNRRKQLKLSLEDISKKTKVSTAIISQYERNIKYPTATVLYDLKEAYEMTDVELLQWLEFINQNKKENN